MSVKDQQAKPAMASPESDKIQIDIIRICKHMGLYYKEMEDDYAIDDSNRGLFQAHCEENGFE